MVKTMPAKTPASSNGQHVRTQTVAQILDREKDNNKLLNSENFVTIADEVDAQLKQQMLRYMAANAVVLKSRLH